MFDGFLKEMAEFFRRRGLKPGDPAPVVKVRNEEKQDTKGGGGLVQRRPYDLFLPGKSECDSENAPRSLTDPSTTTTTPVSLAILGTSQKAPTTTLDVDLANVYRSESTPGNGASSAIVPVRPIGSALAELVSLTCAPHSSRSQLSVVVSTRSTWQSGDAARRTAGHVRYAFFVASGTRWRERRVDIDRC